MKNTRWTMSAAALCVMALSVYGCSSDSAADDDDDDDTTSSSSSGKAATSSGGKTSSSSSGGKTSSSSSSGGSTSSGGSSGSTSSSSGGSSSSSGDAGASSSSGDGGSGACVAITGSAWGFSAARTVFYGLSDPAVVAPSDGDEIHLTFGEGGDVTGSQDLSTQTASLATCAQCMSLVAFPTDDDAIFLFQKSGTLNITAVDTEAGTISATATSVKFVEGEINEDTGAFTETVNGRCATLATAQITVAAQ